MRSINGVLSAAVFKVFVRIFFGIFAVFTLSITSLGYAHPLLEFALEKERTGTIGRSEIQEIFVEAQKFTDPFGRITPELQEALSGMESQLYHQWDPEVQQLFQTLIAQMGGKILNPIKMPADQTPYWLLSSQEFAHYQTKKLPTQANIVIVGAGLTGASAAYHLTSAAQSGKSVVVIEADRPAAQSSGRNGGNFQLLPESYLNHYDGLVQERYKVLKNHPTAAPHQDEAALKKEATRQALQLLRFSYHNFERFTSIVEKEKIDCDYSPGGWLRIPGTADEEKAIHLDLPLLALQSTRSVGGGPQVELLNAEAIRKQFEIPAQYSGRLIYRSGNYHPYKFVVSLLKLAMAKGVQLYTGVHVQKISNTRPGFIVIETSEGSIKADQVIVATNAFTPLLFPELSAIECYPSQILNLEHVKNKLNGMTITENCGDIYYNFPASKAYAQDDDHSMGMLHFGLDSTQPIQHLSDLNRDENKSELEFQQMMSLIHERFPDTKQQPPSRFWRGPMAFTPDRTPVIGFMFSKQPPHLNQKEVIIAAGFQGYGGSYCTQAGYIAAQMALTGEVQEDAPEDLFGTTRFLDSKFLSAPRH